MFGWIVHRNERNNMKRKEMCYLLILTGIIAVFLLGVGIGKQTKKKTDAPVSTEQKEKTVSVTPVPTVTPNALNIDVSDKIKADYGYCMEYLREKYPGHAFDIVDCQDTQDVTMFTMRADDDGETQFTVCVIHCGDTVTAVDTFTLES